MANRHKVHKEHKKMSKGGKTKSKINEYNAQGSPEVSEAKNEKEGFKRGGGIKGKHAGHAEGTKSHMRLDKKPRKLAAGGSPYSSAKKMSMYGTGGESDGHQGDGPKGEDKED